MPRPSGPKPNFRCKLLILLENRDQRRFTATVAQPDDAVLRRAALGVAQIDRERIETRTLFTDAGDMDPTKPCHDYPRPSAARICCSTDSRRRSDSCITKRTCTRNCGRFL